MRTRTAVMSALLSLVLAPAALAVVPTTEAITPADAFLEALASHCGKAYAGRIFANEPAAAESKALFERQGLKASMTNVWAIELEPGARYVYAFARPGRLFRVEFDLTTPVPLPPPPWGSEANP
jgi:hypothetical protein